MTAPPKPPPTIRAPSAPCPGTRAPPRQSPGGKRTAHRASIQTTPKMRPASFGAANPSSSASQAGSSRDPPASYRGADAPSRAGTNRDAPSPPGHPARFTEESIQVGAPRLRVRASIPLQEVLRQSIAQETQAQGLRTCLEAARRAAIRRPSARAGIRINHQKLRLRAGRCPLAPAQSKVSKSTTTSACSGKNATTPSDPGPSAHPPPYSRP